jgi:oxygen-independent coproporphyrinogen III oxidase
MAGIYIHVPFCKKACHYCNFHFSTQIQHIDDYVQALLREIALQKNYLSDKVETLYFGGGTPSLLNESQLEKIFTSIASNFPLADHIECTLEANPDDINLSKTRAWKNIGINRLSIGIQSFQKEALSWMNRAHNTQQSHLAIENAKLADINNISTDLIYGTPLLTDEALMSDIEILNEYDIPHISCYALTVEEKTALYSLIQKQKIENVDSEKQARHFEIVVEQLNELGYEHYEVSNFAKTGQRSQHNSNYWKGVPYLGLGPSAHSYNKDSRQWNIANNHLYIQSILQDKIPFEIEHLDRATQYNEFMMIRLRLLEGFSMEEIKDQFGDVYVQHTLQVLTSLLLQEKIENTPLGYAIPKKARFLSDGIASDFFIV